uniref:Uncharacterized protein n=1 Tax=Nelumbo nucifera TaxID=4432 RepID=A0A822ZWQ3_NELNU|nr:TPA_asm: hypothetical protein HUJ06_004578 [Nelumbo nucifera]
METGVAENKSSYTYWVRDVTKDAAPLPVPRQLSADDLSKQTQPNSLGSVWNSAGTWEEKNLSSWASNRMKVLLQLKISLHHVCLKLCYEEWTFNRIGRCDNHFF